MKIFYIINGRFPTEKANGYQVSQMCQAFAENGAEVVVLRPRRKPNPAHVAFQNNLKGFYHLRNELKVKDIWSIDFQDLFHRLHPVFDKFQSITNLLHSFSFVFGLCLFFLKQSASPKDVIYLRDVNILSWMSPFLKSYWRKNIYLELHYLPTTQIKKLRYLRILEKAQAVICITNKMKIDLLGLGYPDDRVSVEHDGVDLQTFDLQMSQKECRKLFGYPENEFIIGYVGNFHTNGQEKGVDDLIRAASYVLKKHPEVSFYFVGGPMSRVPRYQQIIQELNLPKEKFHFFDRRPIQQVPASMAACDVLTIPLPWNEHFAFYMSPMKLFEYMASGRCIVATNVEAICEVLVDRQNAILAQHSDIKDFAMKLLVAINDNTLRQKVAKAAQEQVPYYSWKLRAQRILASFRQSEQAGKAK